MSVFEIILNGALDCIFFILDLLFGWVSLPKMPLAITVGVNSYLDLIFNNLSFLNFFIPIHAIKICLPIFLVLINFNLIYNSIMWVLRKIPVLNIK